MKTFKELMEKVKEPTGDLKKACWKGYTAVGMKMKNGRKVPNCVPEEVELDEANPQGMSDREYARHELGKGKKPEVKVGAKVTVDGGGSGVVQKIYDKELSNGQKRKFIHLKDHKGRDFHHRYYAHRVKVMEEVEVNEMDYGGDRGPGRDGNADSSYDPSKKQIHLGSKHLVKPSEVTNSASEILTKHLASKKKVTKEEVEQIDELSKATVKSYSDKSFRDRNDTLSIVHRKYSSPEEKAKYKAIADKRGRGQSLALAKLSPGGTLRYSDRTIAKQAKVVAKEEVTLDEMSKLSDALAKIKHDFENPPADHKDAKPAPAKKPEPKKGGGMDYYPDSHGGRRYMGDSVEMDGETISETGHMMAAAAVAGRQNDIKKRTPEEEKKYAERQAEKALHKPGKNAAKSRKYWVKKVNKLHGIPEEVEQIDESNEENARAKVRETHSQILKKGYKYIGSEQRSVGKDDSLVTHNYLSKDGSHIHHMQYSPYTMTGKGGPHIFHKKTKFNAKLHDHLTEQCFNYFDEASPKAGKNVVPPTVSALATGGIVKEEGKDPLVSSWNKSLVKRIQGSKHPEHVKTNLLAKAKKSKSASDAELVHQELDNMHEESEGENKPLGKVMRAGDGKKKFKVYVKNAKGNTVKVGFGDPNMEIKRDDPERRKNFRARHNCDSATDRTTPRYWSCKNWSKKPVSDIAK